MERCVADVVKIARELNSDESRYFQAVSSAEILQWNLKIDTEYNGMVPMCHLFESHLRAICGVFSTNLYVSLLVFLFSRFHVQ